MLVNESAPVLDFANLPDDVIIKIGNKFYTKKDCITAMTTREKRKKNSSTYKQRMKERKKVLQELGVDQGE